MVRDFYHQSRFQSHPISMDGSKVEKTLDFRYCDTSLFPCKNEYKDSHTNALVFQEILIPILVPTTDLKN